MSHKVVFKNKEGKVFSEVYATKEEACWRAEELKCHLSTSSHK